MRQTDGVNNVALWVTVAVVLLVATALQLLVIVLSLAGGSSVPLSTLSGVLTLILGIYAIVQVRRIRSSRTTH